DPSSRARPEPAVAPATAPPPPSNARAPDQRTAFSRPRKWAQGPAGAEEGTERAGRPASPPARGASPADRGPRPHGGAGAKVTPRYAVRPCLSGRARYAIDMKAQPSREKGSRYEHLAAQGPEDDVPG